MVKDLATGIGRRLVIGSAAATAAAGVPAWAPVRIARAAARYRRHNVTSAEGRRMLAI